MARITSRNQAVSTDLRWAVVHMHYARKLSCTEISETTGVHLRTVQRILRRFRDTGDAAALEGRGSRPHKLTDGHQQYLSAYLEHSPDAYLDELQTQLQEMCGTDVSISTVWRAIHRMGFTSKKISKVALERSHERRMNFIAHIGINYEAEQLVFVDESSFDRRTAYRGYAWALKGMRAVRSCFYVRGKRYSVLPALSLDGILWCEIVEGAFNTERFIEFIRGLVKRMQPFPAPNSVIVMDNAKIHKAPEIVELVESRGMRVEFLPAYSPDFNPIEQAFSIMKAHFRRHYPHFARQNTTGTNPADDADARIMLLDVVYSITPEHAAAFFSHSRYI